MGAISCGQGIGSSEKVVTAVDTEMRAQLPFNLHYGMSKVEFEHVRDSLKKKGQLDKWGSEYQYDNLRLGLRYDFNDNDELIHFELSSSGLYDPNPTQQKAFIPQIEKMLTEQGINLNAYTKKVSEGGYRQKKYNKQITYSRPGHGEIYISNTSSILVRFCNDEAVENNNTFMENIIKQAEQDAASGKVMQKVENSAMDGSVRQVKDYLKKTLADPNSYEGIEWSPVQTTSDGYKVRHKFRAKNGFGGYVIEEHIFCLNKYGEVVNVI